VITDALGNVISRRDFMPFGEEIYANIGGRTENQKYTQNGVDNIRKRFTGYEKDTETGLDFAEARYYHNEHGRFTAVDPLLASGKSANPQTFNRYSYTMNNPVNLIDPSGMISESTGACGERCPNSGPYSDGPSEDYDSGHRSGLEGSSIYNLLNTILNDKETNGNSSSSGSESEFDKLNSVISENRRKMGYGRVVSGTWKRERIRAEVTQFYIVNGQLISVDGPEVAGYVSDVTEAVIEYSPTRVGPSGPLPTSAKAQPYQFDGDQRAHLIGRSLGGGDWDGNLYSGDGSVNNSQYKRMENYVRKTLTANQTWRAYITIRLIYRPNARTVTDARANTKKYRRPIAVRYTVRFRNDDGNIRGRFSRSLVFRN
jgi:RHS repeat-associated protein